jgi:hypothetical protein
VQTFLFSSPLVSDGQACFHTPALHFAPSHFLVFSHTEETMSVRTYVCISLASTRLFPSLPLSLARSLSLSRLPSPRREEAFGGESAVCPKSNDDAKRTAGSNYY